MKVTDFLVSPAICVPGETVNISFNVKAESGDAINGLRIWMTLPGIGEELCHADDGWTISVGSTKQVNLEVKMSSASVAAHLGNSRSFSMETFGVQFGYFGSRVDVTFPFTFLDAWYSPGISIFSLERAADGMPSDEGENLLADVLLGASAQAKAENMSVRLYYRRGSAADTSADYIDLTDGLDELLAGVTDDAQLVSQTFSKTYDWYFLLWFGDVFESAQAGALVVRAFANMHLSGMETGGVCFGGFCSSTDGVPKLESYYPAYFYGGIQGVTNYSLNEIPTGGTWVDGKPIYRYVLVASTTADGGSQVIGKLPSAFETIVNVRGLLRVNSAGNVVPLPYAHFNSTSLTADYIISADGTISIQLGTAYSNQHSVWIVIEYTKADDV